MELLNIVLLKTFASTYDCDTYGSGLYSADGQCTTDGSLVDTGSPYFIPLVIGITLIVLGATLLAVKLLHRRKASSNRPN